MESYKLKYNGDDATVKYFSEHPVSQWSFLEFEAAVNKNKSIKPNTSKTKSAYLNVMRLLNNSNDTPAEVKKEIGRLIDKTQEKSFSTTFNISVRDSSTVNAIGTGVLNSTQTLLPPQPQQPQQQQDSQPQTQTQPQTQPQPQPPQDENEEYEDETRFPSDLSIDHHPGRTNDYSISFQGNSAQSEDIVSDIKWKLNDHCISDLCLNVKSKTIEMINMVNPAQLSDVRLLALNDIYLFDKNQASSISKYFTLAVHNALKLSLLFETYYPERGVRCYDWCMSLEESPPPDWLSSLTLCAKMLSDACESKNILDVHTAQVLTSILPAFINGPPDNSIEDSYVHNYLSP